MVYECIHLQRQILSIISSLYYFSSLKKIIKSRDVNFVILQNYWLKHIAQLPRRERDLHTQRQPSVSLQALKEINRTELQVAGGVITHSCNSVGWPVSNRTIVLHESDLSWVMLRPCEETWQRDATFHYSARGHSRYEMSRVIYGLICRKLKAVQRREQSVIPQWIVEISLVAESHLRTNDAALANESIMRHEEPRFIPRITAHPSLRKFSSIVVGQWQTTERTFSLFIISSCQRVVELKW